MRQTAAAGACRGSLPLRPPSHYGCVARVLANLFIHARRARALGYTGDGGLYMLEVGLMALACLMVLLAIEKGALWREREEEE